MWMKHKLGLVALAAVILMTMSVTACQRNNNGAQNDVATPTTSPTTTPTTSPTASTTASPTDSPDGTAAPTPTEAVSTANVEAIYQSRCVACHAADLSGGMGPGLQDVGARMSAQDIAARIEQGGNGMMAYKGVLTDEEIQGLVNWLAAKKG